MAEMSDERRVRVVIADDETLMRAGLRLMIDGARGIEVVAEAVDGQSAVDAVATHDPDVVLMDVRMPGLSGLDATERLVASGARARVVVLTAFDTDDYLLRSLRAGAVSFLLKDSPPEAVVDAVLCAADDEARFSPSSLRRLVRVAAATPSTSTSGSASASDLTAAASDLQARRTRSLRATSLVAPPSGITEREWEVARLVAQGLTNAEIAQTLFLSLPTVKTHTARLFDKLHVTNRVQLALRVIESNNERGVG